MRSHYCGQIDDSLVEKEVKICGWVHRLRDLGGIIFIDLRDREGLIQIIIEPEKENLIEIAKKLHHEWVISAEGKVRHRPQGLENSEIKNGNVEIVASKISILNRANPLPFPINEQQEVNEELRLSYRYLDLRRPEMTANIMLRAKITKIIRHFLDKEGFIEIETPILTKTTPEGARDYLVPSRIHPGNFYALPQSPQIFKQLLMIAGLDRYYQLARCFRDEDLRADRQPEFTQLDIEMSFVEPENIKLLTESLMRHLFQKTLKVQLLEPFPTLTYQEALEKYGTDKPDLRISLQLTEIKDLVTNVAFNAFANAVCNPNSRVAALRIPNGCSFSRNKCDSYVELAKKLGLNHLSYLKIDDRSLGSKGLRSSLLKFISPETFEKIFNRTLCENGDLFFFAAGATEILNNTMGYLRIKLGHDLGFFEKNNWRFIWIVDFPMFEKKDSKWSPLHHPFTAPIEENLDLLEKNPAQSLAKAYDLVLNGVELGGGSIRISNADLQRAIFRILSISDKTSQNQFGHLLNALQYGCPPHGGIALGLDRLVMIMAQVESIREVIPFPKTLTAYCPLTEAPSEVSEEQLKDLQIKISKRSTT